VCDHELRMSGPPDGAPPRSTKRGELLVSSAVSRAAPELDPVSCTFRDATLEAEFRRQSFQSNLIQIRIAHVLGVFLWIVWGLLVRGDLGADQRFDLEMRYGVFIPIILISLAVSFTGFYRRIWQPAAAAAILATGFAWIGYVSVIDTMPIDYGYVGVILIMTFGYTLIRVRFALALAVSGVLIVGYLAIGLATNELSRHDVKLPLFYLLSFWALGMIAAYVLERSARLLFLRERQLERERARSEDLLLNVLPSATVERLKQREEEAGETRIADGIEEATVLFVDAVGFTVEAARTAPDVLVGALDELFSLLDALADRIGLEKIKTIGDAYLAVAGAPRPRPDHVAAAATMALAVRDAIRDARWPSGNPIEVRMGIATGPLVAGVIGRRKFAYDLWGDTVNLASRLEFHGEPGQIVVSEAVAEQLADDFVFSPSAVIDLKGKGPTSVRCLLGRPGDAVTTRQPAAEAASPA
jgi:class 3 adenylate cyclase